MCTLSGIIYIVGASSFNSRLTAHPLTRQSVSIHAKPHLLTGDILSDLLKALNTISPGGNIAVAIFFANKGLLQEPSYLDQFLI